MRWAGGLPTGQCPRWDGMPWMAARVIAKSYNKRRCKHWAICSEPPIESKPIGGLRGLRRRMALALTVASLQLAKPTSRDDYFFSMGTLEGWEGGWEKGRSRIQGFRKRFFFLFYFAHGWPLCLRVVVRVFQLTARLCEGGANGRLAAAAGQMEARSKVGFGPG